ncbi:hypothetical protein D3C76_1130190 [compost metagenome]
MLCGCPGNSRGLANLIRYPRLTSRGSTRLCARAATSAWAMASTCSSLNSCRASASRLAPASASTAWSCARNTLTLTSSALKLLITLSEQVRGVPATSNSSTRQRVFSAAASSTACTRSVRFSRTSRASLVLLSRLSRRKNSDEPCSAFSKRQRCNCCSVREAGGNQNASA